MSGKLFRRSLAVALLLIVHPYAAAHPSAVADACDSEISVGEDLCASVFHPGVGANARHLAFGPDGSLFVSFRRSVDGHGLARVTDTDGDGVADGLERFGDTPGTGLAVHAGALYLGTETEVWRYPLSADGVPAESPEVVVSGFPEQSSHATKSLTFDGEGRLYVNVGAPSNACQTESRTPGSPGVDPCPQLERQAGVWRFDGDRLGQTQADDGERFATGIRNAVALEWDAGSQAVHAAQHGRDQLTQLWPDLYDETDSAELPSEEFLRLEEGTDAGWPYCYHDWRQGRKVSAPEYGGDGETVGRCAEADAPLMAFPGHWAPNDLVFHRGAAGDALPTRYRGAFIAFHGSWNRAPLPQAGYKVVFVPMGDDGRIQGDHEVFADGFAGAEELASPGEARYRPMGLAVAPDGALFIVDSRKGRIWRVSRRD